MFHNYYSLMEYHLHNNLLNISHKFPDLISIYGKGLIAAIVFSKNHKNINRKLKKLVELCIKDGLLLVYTGRESVKIGPPLTITKNAINEGTEILKKNINILFKI